MINQQKKYDVILADPPWHFDVWNEDTGNGRSATSHYETMTIEEICNLPVAGFAADNCALFLWCVWPSILEYPQRVIEAWGFRYATLAFDWFKAKKHGFGFATGMGHYFRANSEPCLLAVKGNMPIPNRGILSVIYSPRREHSQKPPEQYEKIERAYPHMRYLELFARKKHSEKWDVWGNEIENDIELIMEENINV